MRHDIVTDRKIMKEFLQESDHQMLMYDSGAGGEFLIYLISKFSKNFATIKIKTERTNRTSILYPDMLGAMSFLSRYIDPVEATLEYFYKDKISLEKTLEQYIHDIKAEYNPARFLLRSHYTLDHPFIGKKYVLHITDPLHVKYVTLLRHIKINLKSILVTEDTIEPYIRNYSMDRFACFCTNKEDAAKAKATSRRLFEYLNYQHVDNLKHINEGHLSLIAGLTSNDPNVELSKLLGVFSLKPDELLDLLSTKINCNLIQEGATIINYSDLFVPGYLEDLFNIDIDNRLEFRAEWDSWHAKNLVLIDQYGFSSVEFKKL